MTMLFPCMQQINRYVQVNIIFKC